MPTFEDTTGRFSSAEWSAIGETLERWTGDQFGREIVRNLRVLERFLRVSCMEGLLRAVLSAYGAPLIVLSRAYQSECYKHIRRGGPVHVHPVLIGRAIELGQLRKRLQESPACYPLFYGNEILVDIFIDRLLGGAPLTPEEMSLLMSDYSAWATWDSDDSSSDPFRFGKDADHIRASLGLDPNSWFIGSRLVLFVYELPMTVELCRPTIADAGLHPFFEPPTPPFDSYGKTRVWHLPRAKHEPKPRPESVHEPVPMGTIRRAHTRDVR
jgi:hypothetical protein